MISSAATASQPTQLSRPVIKISFCSDEFPACCGATVYYDFQYDGPSDPTDEEWEVVRQEWKLGIRHSTVPIFAIVPISGPYLDQTGLSAQMWKHLAKCGEVLSTWRNPNSENILQLIRFTSEEYKETLKVDGYA